MGDHVGQFHFLNHKTGVAISTLYLIPWRELAALHYVRPLVMMLKYK